MREILFKAKRKDNGEWVEGSYSLYPKGNCSISVILDKCKNPPDCDPMWQKVLISHEVDRNTVCQYTGLTDMNGNMIWENDVVKGKYLERGNSHRHIGEVKYMGSSFKVVGVKQYEGYHEELNGSYEIIGNIFDNPELLGEQNG